MTYMKGPKSRERLISPRMIKVQVSSLDDEWRQLGCPDVSVVKVDVEGAEGLVLEGASELIKSCHPSFIVEWHESYLKDFGTSFDQLLIFATKFSYRLYSVPGGVPIDETRTLRMQMMLCSNFALLH